MPIKPMIPLSERVNTNSTLRRRAEDDRALGSSPGNSLIEILDGFSSASSDFSGCAKEGDKVDKGKEKEKDSERSFSHQHMIKSKTQNSPLAPPHEAGKVFV